MDIERWMSSFGEPVDAGTLASPDAVSTVAFIQRHAGHLATLVEVRRTEDYELVVVDFQTGRPQASAYPIKRRERIGIRFSVPGSMPLVYMLRADFPDTEHQQLTLEGAPRAICIDDRPWPEARLTWTPAEFIHRILSWFKRAVRGELHDARQPIDPVLLGSPLKFIISRRLVHDAGARNLTGVHDPDHRQTLRVVPAEEVDGPPERLDRICIFTYRVPPESMVRMQFAPNNMSNLAEMLQARGVDLLADLRARLSGWLDEGKNATWRLHARFAVIVEMPIVSPNQERRNGVDLRAYLSDKSAGDIAVAIGIALRSERRSEGSATGYVRAVGVSAVDQQALRSIDVQVVEVHYEFDRTLATQLSGRTTEDVRKAVIIGAGAIGSHVSECLMREGRFVWIVVDHDQLLPHNLAKHTAREQHVSRNKAVVLAESLAAIVDNGAASVSYLAADVTDAGTQRPAVDRVLNDAEVIIDASASVLAARYLSDHRATGRRLSVFFSPSGNAGVLLAEPEDRSVTLRDLEAQYLGLVAQRDSLATHLATPDRDFAYTGACRAITNMIPESSVMALSGLVSRGVGTAVDQSDGAIRIWSMSDAGAVEVTAVTPAAVIRVTTGDWTITIDDGCVQKILETRSARLPHETGGILFGVVDIPSKTIHIVTASPAPPDSKETSTGFTRGTVGVQQTIDRVFQRTKGQVRYVGEWHSHPPRSGVMPSGTDLVQLDWLATLFDMDTLPALMLIAGDAGVSVIFGQKPAAAVPEERRAAMGEA
jgi:integrative and conjugative element protein (TIGR02256 family)